MVGNLINSPSDVTTPTVYFTAEKLIFGRVFYTKIQKSCAPALPTSTWTIPCTDVNIFCVFLVSGPEGMPKTWGGVGYNRYAALTRFQPQTVANPALESRCPTHILLSPAIQTNMHANEKGRVIRYILNNNMQQAKDRHRGVPIS